MKVLLSVCLFLAAQFSWAGEAPAQMSPANSVVTGLVLEVKDVESYTYLRLKTNDGEIWAAVSKAPVKKGATVTIEDVITLHNFESKSLKKTFPVILFGSLGGAGTGHDMVKAHAGTARTTVDLSNIQVTKATGANARTVAEIMTKGGELKDKPVLVRGKVVKYNPGIMGKNWIHLRDGSGSEADNSNDILVTSANQTKLGDVVTVKGIVRTDKEFGAGYNYKVLIEEAALQ